jgi:HEAT repeat protein
LYAIGSLGKMGSMKAIPYITEFIHYPKDDVKCSALYALSKIGDSSLIPVFLDALKDRSWSAKSYAMSALIKHGDESVIPPIIERVKAMLSKKRKRQAFTIDHKPDFCEPIEFLNKFLANDNEIQELFHFIKSKKWGYLFEEEQEWLMKHIAFFEIEEPQRSGK